MLFWAVVECVRAVGSHSHVEVSNFVEQIQEC